MLAIVAVSFMNHSTQLLRTAPEFQDALLSLSYRKGAFISTASGYNCRLTYMVGEAGKHPLPKAQRP